MCPYFVWLFEIGSHILRAAPELIFLLYFGIMGVYYLARLVYIFHTHTQCHSIFNSVLKLVISASFLLGGVGFMDVCDCA